MRYLLRSSCCESVEILSLVKFKLSRMSRTNSQYFSTVYRCLQTVRLSRIILTDIFSFFKLQSIKIIAISTIYFNSISVWYFVISSWKQAHDHVNVSREYERYLYILTFIEINGEKRRENEKSVPWFRWIERENMIFIREKRILRLWCRVWERDFDLFPLSARVMHWIRYIKIRGMKQRYGIMDLIE